MKKRKYDLTKFQRIYLTTFKIVYSAIILAAALWMTIPDGPYCILIGAIGLIILIFTFDERKAAHTYSTDKRPLLLVKPEPILLVKNEFEDSEQYSVYENNKNSDSNGMMIQIQTKQMILIQKQTIMIQKMIVFIQKQRIVIQLK